MIALYSGFYPRFCPNCGSQRVYPWSSYEKRDFDAKHSFICPTCQMIYQQSNKADLLKAAITSGGDMINYEEVE